MMGGTTIATASRAIDCSRSSCRARWGKRTIAAGAGLCDPAVVDLVAQEAPARIQDLIGYGAPFDRKSDGSLALGREAAHSLPRIVHVKGDGAGAAISATLAARASEVDCITLLEGFHAIELAMENGRVVGLFEPIQLNEDRGLLGKKLRPKRLVRPGCEPLCTGAVMRNLGFRVGVKHPEAI